MTKEDHKQAGYLKTAALPLGNTMVKILVGEGEKVFFMHKDALVARSLYFRNALTGNWKEAEDKVVKLTDDDPDAFALYEQLVYTGNIPYKDQHVEDEPVDYEYWKCDRNSCDKEYEVLCRLYVFAGKVQDLDAQNATLAALFAKMQDSIDPEAPYSPNSCMPTPEVISIMYSGTTEPSQGRSLLVSPFAYLGDPMTSAPRPDAVPAEFLWDLTEALFPVRDLTDVSRWLKLKFREAN